MFLTTNRAEQLDEAFKSRISVIFKYPKLDTNTLLQIWNNLLKVSSSNLPDEDVIELAKHDINGRQIKNAIRMAQSLAKTDEITITKQYLNDVIDLMELNVLDEDKINQV